MGRDIVSMGTRIEVTKQLRSDYRAGSKAERDRLKLKGITTTKPGALLRNSMTVRKAGDEVDDEPGFFETDTVAHCGPGL